jgi:hypothetical protein
MGKNTTRFTNKEEKMIETHVTRGKLGLITFCLAGLMTGHASAGELPRTAHSGQ